ncbi:MAG: helicase C-terminal domain-containing protein, partial [Actinomycetota bacterium]|nr:helicase C-terminal domain-containing protein [Actinomycetota bacterium]
LWSRGNQFLLMSATLISPQQMAKDLGLEDDEWAYVEMESTFPVENRPVFSVGKTKVTFKTKETAYPVLTEHLGEIIDENPGARILVHTVSYELTRHLFNTLNSGRVMTYWNAGERDRALAKFLDRDDAVMLAPSFERGIDLPGEDCEVIVICKVPSPYLGDKMVKARLYSKGGQNWYSVQTLRAIAQMTGRGMRSRSDWCDTYILDRQFNKLFKNEGRLFPKWWKDALVISPNNPKSRSMVKAAKDRKESRLRKV